MRNEHNNKECDNTRTNPLKHKVAYWWDEEGNIIGQKTFNITEILYEISIILKELNQTIKNNG